MSDPKPETVFVEWDKSTSDDVPPGKTMEDVGTIETDAEIDEHLGKHILVCEDLADRCARTGKPGMQLAAIKMAITAAIVRRRGKKAGDETDDGPVDETKIPTDPEELRKLVAVGGRKS